MYQRKLWKQINWTYGVLLTKSSKTLKRSFIRKIEQISFCWERIGAGNNVKHKCWRWKRCHVDIWHKQARIGRVLCHCFVSKAYQQKSQIISLFSHFQEVLTFHIPLSETCVMGNQEGQTLYLTRHVLLIERFPCGPPVNSVTRQNNEDDWVTMHNRTEKKVPNMSSLFILTVWQLVCKTSSFREITRVSSLFLAHTINHRKFFCASLL